MTAKPPREATPMKTYASTIKKGRLPRRSSKSVKNRSTERTPVYPLTRSRNPATAARRAAWSLGRTKSPCLEDLLERRQVLGVSLEVLPDGGQLPVETRGDTGLQVLRMELSVGVRLRQGIERLVDHITPELRITRDYQPPLTWEQDESRHLEDGISLRLLRGAEGLADLPVHLDRAIVQQDAGIRLRFRHLARDEVHPSAAIEGRQERRVQGDDRLPAELGRDVPVQHVCVSLVHSSQGEVQIHPMDIRDLHGRVDEHGGVQVGLLLLPAHDRQGPPDPGDRGSLRRLDHVLPVFRMPEYWQNVIQASKDRKSTRLNSSHVASSYAVFCLKKKKTCRRTE